MSKQTTPNASPAPAKDILVLRAGHYSPASHKLLQAARQTGRFHIVVVADIRRKRFHYEGFEHVYFDRSTAQAINLSVRRDMQWRCGDYAYYLAAAAHPDFRYLWLLETDLRLSFEPLENFFRKFDECNADFLAANLRAADPQWSWTRHVAQLRPAAWRCFFPLTRVSRDACQHLFAQRQMQADALANDESFTATVLVNDGFKCLELQDVVPDLYASPGFSFDYPVLERAYERMPMSSQIYHPVLTDRLYLKRLRRYYGFPRNRQMIFSEACKAYGVHPKRVKQFIASAAQGIFAFVLFFYAVGFDNPEAQEDVMQGVAAILLAGAVFMAMRRQSED